jgi:hypothetical protein
MILIICLPVSTLVIGLDAANGEWQDHQIRRGDGKGGWITLQASRQVLRHPDSSYTMPFGLVRMENGEIAILCSREKQPPGGPRIVEPIIAFSMDGGATWSGFASIPGTRGRPQCLSYLGGGRLSFITEVFDKEGKPRRIFSDDFGRTWTESIDHPPTKEGRAFGVEGNAWIDRDGRGRATAILELGWHYAPGKSHPKDDATVVFRRSLDGGKTWADEVTPSQWKFTLAHGGKSWLRGVSEGAVVRAANGDLVAALRTDMPPRYFDGPHDDSLEGTAISLSRDDGRTWSDLRFLFEAGRHHANLQRLSSGDLVCTLVVRDDIRDGKLVSHRRGCDALISRDHGKTWDLDRRWELDRFDFLRKDGYWVDGMCGHVASVVLPDGHILSAYSQYLLGASVLIKWKPDSSPSPPTPRVSILTGPKVGEVERYAARELGGYLDKLFHINARPEQQLCGEADVVLVVGNPATNPAVSSSVGPAGWPKISDQGIVLKRADFRGKPALVIGGGSPAATLWAVYELVERWGVRYLLHGDVLPEDPGTFRLPQSDVVLEPRLRIRQWRVVNDFACGPESWGMEDYRRVLDQLAKLRFNRIFASIWPYQPFLDFEVKGIKRQKASLWFDFHYPITDDMPGRHIFGNECEFWNPDLPRGATYKELAAAGEKLVRGILAHAGRRGMQCAISATLTEFPPEFAPLLKDARKVHQLGSMGVVPGPETRVDDAGLGELASAVLQATVQTYPGVDYILLGMPEFRQWADQYEDAWRVLDRRYRLGGAVVLEGILAAASKRKGYPGGVERAVQEVKGDVVALYFYDRLLAELQVMRGTRRPDVKFVFNSVAEELLPVLPRMLPPGSETLNFVDYTPSRILDRREVLGRIPARMMPTSLIYTLHDDNVGLVPQLATGSLHEITKDLRRFGWAGFSTRYWLIGDHDPCVAYLARASWDASSTPEAVNRDQLRAVCGEACVDEMLTVFREVEAATVRLEWHGLGFAFPVPGMIMKHREARPLPAELAAVRSHYERALSAARHARDQASVTGKSLVDYWIGRLEFGIGYFDTVQAVRDTARAESSGPRDEALRHLEVAIRHAKAALEAYASVARDQSDRGAIAIMAEYVYRPLKEMAAETGK